MNIIGINGSASTHSSNLAILKLIKESGAANFSMIIIEDLSVLPHFKTELTLENTPEVVLSFRKQIEEADGVIISTPEYVFSIPSRLKNALEWLVSENILAEKPFGLITASSSGVKGHEELKLILKTLQAKFTPQSTLLIQGVKAKIDGSGNLTDDKVQIELEDFVSAFMKL